MRMLVTIVGLFLFVSASYAQDNLSSESKSCIGCHEGITPGIVGDWKTSAHSKVTVERALEKPKLERRVSAEEVAERFEHNVVGCYECHGLNADKHADNFKHYGFNINVVVSPTDCSTCHPVEVKQYGVSKKANAWANIEKNPVYHTLIDAVIGLKEVKDATITGQPASDYTRQDACFACHGTVVEVKGMKTVDTSFGKIEVPNLARWPNQGVGRINPDGSKGSCTPCHARHAFSIEVARKPFTCGQCHLEPDVPAFNVYEESKHGNIFHSKESEWDFNAVPWNLGNDFKAPTCAVCHVSLVTKPDGSTVIAERSHDFGARLWVRLFGLVYTHPQPKSGDTTVIKNKDGLPLPTTFTDEPASEYLIDKTEQAARKAKMTAVCKGCHVTSWVDAHFRKMDNTLEETDKMTLAATQLLVKAWEAGIADNSNPFDEAIERKWIQQWLFYGNTARYASAMSGAQDYIAFKYGWWGLSKNLQDMKDKIEMKIQLKKQEEKEEDED